MIHSMQLLESVTDIFISHNFWLYSSQFRVYISQFWLYWTLNMINPDSDIIFYNSEFICHIYLTLYLMILRWYLSVLRFWIMFCYSEFIFHNFLRIVRKTVWSLRYKVTVPHYFSARCTRSVIQEQNNTMIYKATRCNIHLFFTPATKYHKSELSSFESVSHQILIQIVI